MEWPSVAKQLSECLGVTRKTNKAMDVTVDLTFASWDGTVGAHAVEHFNAERWVGVRRDARKVEDIFSSASASSASAGTDLVYLSPDAEDVLEDVDADTVYVIGGIVDLAARGTATSLPRARAAGMRTARLPIREHLPRCTSQILNIDPALKVLC